MQLISIITVCKNAQASICSTIESVLFQTYPNLEYLIFDAISTDNTVVLANQYNNQFAIKNINFKVISEKDLGIYHAMNKGIMHSSGDWVYFLNCGDLLYDFDVLNKIFHGNKNYNSDIIYGNTLIKDKNSIIYPPKIINKLFFYQDTICHQSIFMKSNVFERVGYFNLSYKIISDRVFLYHAISKKCRFEYINLTISIWESEGFSTTNVSLFLKEVNLFRAIHFKRIIIFKIKFKNLICKLLRDKFKIQK